MNTEFVKLRRAVSELRRIIDEISPVPDVGTGIHLRPGPISAAAGAPWRKPGPSRRALRAMLDGLRTGEYVEADARADREALLRKAMALARLYRSHARDWDSRPDSETRRRHLRSLATAARKAGPDLDHLRAEIPEIGRLAEAAERAASMPASKPHSKVFEFCMRELVDAYSEVTGRERDNHFITLACAWCECAGRRFQSKPALAKSLERMQDDPLRESFPTS